MRPALVVKHFHYQQKPLKINPKEGKEKENMEEIYNKKYKGGKTQTSKGVSIYYDYENHYNKKLNKCFMLIDERSVMGSMIKLMDVNENKLYGSCRVGKNENLESCHFLRKSCKTYEEWVLRVKPYMEE